MKMDTTRTEGLTMTAAKEGFCTIEEALEELRSAAPAFAAQARFLASRERFAEAVDVGEVVGHAGAGLVAVVGVLGEQPGDDRIASFLRMGDRRHGLRVLVGERDRRPLGGDDADAGVDRRIAARGRGHRFGLRRCQQERRMRGKHRVELRVLPHVGSDHFPMLIGLSCQPDEARREQPEPAERDGDREEAAEIVEEQEGVVLLRWTETDGTMQMNACSFNGGATLENLAYTSGVWHEGLLSRRSTANPLRRGKVWPASERA